MKWGLNNMITPVTKRKSVQVYIILFHGRNDAIEQMDDWGQQGPIFGPFDYVHTTYGSEIKLGKDNILAVVDDLVYYDGILYGDWSICTLGMFDTTEHSRIQAFDQNKANLASLVSESVGVRSLENAKKLWEEFGNIPITNEEKITQTWNQFPKGTHRENIWHWFEETFNLLVTKDLMGF